MGGGADPGDTGQAGEQRPLSFRHTTSDFFSTSVSHATFGGILVRLVLSLMELQTCYRLLQLESVSSRVPGPPPAGPAPAPAACSPLASSAPPPRYSAWGSFHILRSCLHPLGGKAGVNGPVWDSVSTQGSSSRASLAPIDGLAREKGEHGNIYSRFEPSSQNRCARNRVQ